MKKFWLIFLLPLFLISCPEEEIAPEDNAPLTAEAQIGPAGGILEAEGITLIVPPGSFPVQSTVSILADKEQADDFEENRVTPIYRIDGIPVRTEGPFTIQIKYQGNLNEESFLAMGESDEMLETGEEETTYAVFDATDSSGYLIAEIPTFARDPEEETGLKSAADIAPHSWIFLGVSSMTSYEGKYFSFKFPSRTATQRLFVLSEYMDEAMQAYFELKLTNQESIEAAIKLNKKKPQVLVTSRDKTAPGAYKIKMPDLSPAKKEEGGVAFVGRFKLYLDIKVNISETHLAISTDEILKSYAYMWVYRMLYYIYLGDSMDWYAHASTLWMKEKYTGISDYTLLDFLLKGKSPFLGMEAGKNNYKGKEVLHSVLGGKITTQVLEHAIGMTPFLKYLDQRYPNDKDLYYRIIKKILQSDTKKAMEGIINALDEPEYQWWPGFFEEYLTRQLVDIQAKEFLKLFPGVDYQVDFFYEKDTLIFNEAEYADLSARLYNVSFLFPSFEKEATLNLKVGPPRLNLDYVTSLAFGLKNNQMEYFDQSSDLTITNLRALKANDYSSIVVVVVNSGNEPTTDNNVLIELETRMQTAPEDINYVLINSINARSTYTDNSGATYEGSVLYMDGTPRKGELVNHTFTATWSEPYSDGSTSGTLVIDFDPADYPRRITGMNMTVTRKLSDTRKFTITGESIDFSGYRDPSGTIITYNFNATGSEVCNYLTYIDEDYKSSDGNYTYSTDGVPICDDKSSINMKLYYLEE